MTESEKRLADFVGEYTSGPETFKKQDLEFESCRVLLSNKRLVLAEDADNKLIIPLSDVFDLGKSHIPTELRGYISNAISIGFRKDGREQIIMLKAKEEALEKFKYLMFKLLINGAEIIVQHPARLGGRVLDSDWKKSTLKINRDGLVVSQVVGIDLNSINEVSLTKKKLQGETKKVLKVDHQTEKGMATTYLFIPNARHLNILGRFIRSEYERISKEVDDIELRESEKKVIVSVFSGITEEQLPQMLSQDASQVNMLINDLVEKGVLQHTSSGLELTKKGQIVANKKVEDVNVA